MFQKNDYVVYKKNVCIVKDIKQNAKNGKESYLLIPIDDDSLKIEIPTENANDYIRRIISKTDAEKIISKIPDISPFEIQDEKYIESEYKSYIQAGTYEDFIKVIKTAYLRNQKRITNKKKANEKDTHYFELAEKYLYNELAIALNLSFDETKNYIIGKMEGLMEG